MTSAMNSEGTMKKFQADLCYGVAKILITELEDEDKNKQDIARSTLLALRRTTPDLADATVIKAALFKTIKLRATQSHLMAVRDTNPNFLAPFVQKVTFLPSPDHLYINTERLKKLFRGWDKEATEATITKHIIAHRRRSSEDKDLLSNGIVENIWSAFLRQLQIVDNFSISSLLGNHPMLPDPMRPTTYSDTTNDYADLMEILCKGSYAGHVEFMGTALQCLGSVPSKVKTLEIGCEFLQCFKGWRDSPGWQSNMILDNLHSMNFTSIPLRDEQFGGLENSLVVSLAAGSILERWNTSLEHFELARYATIPVTVLWSSNGLHLDLLRTMKLEGVVLNPRTVPEGIFSMPNLEDIRLKNCIAAPWKPIFEAVHQCEKTKPLHITFQNVWYRFRSDLSFEFSLDPDLSDETFNQEVARLDGNMDPVLRARMYGQIPDLSPPPNVTDLYRYFVARGPWTRNLELCFGT